MAWWLEKLLAGVKTWARTRLLGGGERFGGAPPRRPGRPTLPGLEILEDRSVPAALAPGGVGATETSPVYLVLSSSSRNVRAAQEFRETAFAPGVHDSRRAAVDVVLSDLASPGRDGWGARGTFSSGGLPENLHPTPHLNSFAPVLPRELAEAIAAGKGVTGARSASLPSHAPGGGVRFDREGEAPAEPGGRLPGGLAFPWSLPPGSAGASPSPQRARAANATLSPGTWTRDESGAHSSDRAAVSEQASSQGHSPAAPNAPSRRPHRPAHRPYADLPSAQRLQHRSGIQGWKHTPDHHPSRSGGGSHGGGGGGAHKGSRPNHSPRPVKPDADRRRPAAGLRPAAVKPARTGGPAPRPWAAGRGKPAAFHPHVPTPQESGPLPGAPVGHPDAPGGHAGAAPTQEPERAGLTEVALLAATVAAGPWNPQRLKVTPTRTRTQEEAPARDAPRDRSGG
jgi:hypothetical protein